MTEFNEMLSLLEAERERYILESVRLERRLESIRNQVAAIDNLILGYIGEKQYHQYYQHLPQSRTQAYLEEDRNDRDILSLEENIESEVNSDIDLPKEKLNPIIDSGESQPQGEKFDISDIPKMKGGRQSESLPMLPKYQGYSIKNAIIILMRYQPNTHFHINTIVRNLYGDLTKKQYQTARVSVTKALSLGFKSGLWFKVLHSPGVYTLHYEKGITAKTPEGQ
ncbi:MAG: hypothetical protein AAF915_15315 [Cyanobacteria bacterium P01_D01_bin.50]